MPKAIAFIPHKERVFRHKIDYLKAIADAMDYPYQAEDGRDMSPIQQQLAKECYKYSDLPYWMFTDCCTDSLQIAVEVLTNPSDTIIIPAYGWRAFSNAPTIMGREIEFCDIDDTGNIDLNKLEVMIKQKPAAVIIVHNFGTIVDVSQISGICNFYGVKIIEDAAPSFYMGEPYAYKPGHSSDIVCYSFDFTKFPGCLGSGGGLATRNAELADRIYELQAHGTNKQKQIVGIGTKSFLDNTSCAVLLKELEFFEQDQYRERRRQIATWYKNNLPYGNIPGENYVWERYTMSVPSFEVEEVIQKLNSVKCLARTFFKEPLHLLPWLNPEKDDCPKTVDFCASTVHLPSHHYLTDEELERIKSVL